MRQQSVKCVRYDHLRTRQIRHESEKGRESIGIGDHYKIDLVSGLVIKCVREKRTTKEGVELRSLRILSYSTME